MENFENKRCGNKMKLWKQNEAEAAEIKWSCRNMNLELIKSCDMQKLSEECSKVAEKCGDYQYITYNKYMNNLWTNNTNIYMNSTLNDVRG